MNLPSVRRLVFPERRRILADKIALHSNRVSRVDIERIQVDRFNIMWDRCLREIPFYRAWRAEHDLPRTVSSLAEVNSFPTLDKLTLIERSDEIFQNGAIKGAFVSGGSTGAVTRYPRGRRDDKAFYANTYLGRSWSDIAPLDPSILIWNHMHLFGAGGPARLLRRRRRQIADRLLNITRLDAYNLSAEQLHAHYLTINRGTAVYLVGYTLAMTQIARYMERNGLALDRPHKVRAVILTAETVTDLDIELIERAFEVPCVIEYGTAETGVMACSRHGTLPLHVFWDSYICAVDPDGSLRVTTLDRRLFPLVNYSTGDRVEVLPGDNPNPVQLRTVIGRLKDLVYVSDMEGRSLALSCRLPVHILKSSSHIVGYQFDQRTPTRLHILLQSDETLELTEVSRYFSNEIGKIVHSVDPASITFEQVDRLATTAAGKHALFVP